MKATTRLLLFTGLLIPAIFWISTIIGARLQGTYNHFRDTISQLGAIGTRSENFMTVATWLCVFLSVFFLIGLVNICRQLNLNTLPLLGVVGFSIMFAWAATFHSGNSMHSKSGPVLLLLLAGPLLSFFLWKGRELKALRVLSLLSFIITLFILFRIVAPDKIRDNYTGLIQRFVHLGWTIWFISLSLVFLRLTKNPNDLPANTR